MNVKKQRGVVLLVCLVMLLLLTVIGLASMSASTLQERMAGGARDSNLAFQAAEASLRVGEAYVKQQVAASADPMSLFQEATNCPTVTAAQWSAPVGLENKPHQPTCRVSSFYAGSESTDGYPFICETDGSKIDGRDLVCLSRTFLFNVEATGYGSGEVEVHLRSTVAIAISGQN